MTCAALVIGDARWWWLAVPLLLAAAGLLWRSYRRARLSRDTGGLAVGLKTCGMTLLAVCLVEPLWSGVRARPKANLFAVLVDRSGSMQIRDEPGGPTRAERLQRLIRGEASSWQARLGQDFDVRRYVFDARLEQTAEFDSVSFDGSRTALRSALETLRARLAGRPLAGVLLFTDGNATDWNAEDPLPAGLPPVYPVVVGSDTLRDVRVGHVAVTQTSFEDAPVTIHADAHAAGYDGAELVAQLCDEAGRIVQEQTQALTPGRRAAAFRFQLRPSAAGVSFYRLRVAARGETDQFDRPAQSREATPLNNARWIQIDRGSGPFRVLYVAGRPNWEFKFLRRAVEADRQVDLVGLIRIARREARFDWRGRPGDAGNALFRGFRSQADAETEAYDEPVLVRLNTKDADELRAGFPKAAEDLFGFHALILDDVEAEFFTRDQLALIEKFVAERGGSLLMLGGAETFAAGGYRHTPLEGLLPVYLDRAPPPSPHARFRLVLTRDGWLQPWIRLRSTEADERQRLAQMPPFHTLNRVSGLKPGATGLAHVVDPSGAELPALVVQRFGRGRTAAVLLGDLWRWQLRRNEPADEDLAKAWRQTVRWLVADVPERFSIDVQPVADSHDALEIRTRVLTTDFQPVDNADVQLAVTTPSGESIRVTAEAALDEPGVFRAVYVPRSEGVHRLLATIGDADGRESGAAATGWSCQPAADEFRTVEPNRELMERLAEASGGRVVRAEELDRFVAELPHRSVPVVEEWSFPWWHQPWVFLLAVVCLTGEWGLRRWKGLP